MRDCRTRRAEPSFNSVKNLSIESLTVFAIASCSECVPLRLRFHPLGFAFETRAKRSGALYRRTLQSRYNLWTSVEHDEASRRRRNRVNRVKRKHRGRWRWKKHESKCYCAAFPSEPAHVVDCLAAGSDPVFCCWF